MKVTSMSAFEIRDDFVEDYYNLLKSSFCALQINFQFRQFSWAYFVKIIFWQRRPKITRSLDVVVSDSEA